MVEPGVNGKYFGVKNTRIVFICFLPLTKKCDFRGRKTDKNKGNTLKKQQAKTDKFQVLFFVYFYIKFQRFYTPKSPLLKG